MRHVLCAIALAALLLAGSLTPTLARSSSAPQPGMMCVRGVEGACNPGLPGWGHDGRRWTCRPVMPTAPAGGVRSHAWICGWTPVRGQGTPPWK